MKNLVRTLSLILLFGCSVVFAQELGKEIQIVFKITEAHYDGEDVTSHILDKDAYTVFYTSPAEEGVFLANMFLNQESLSFGPVYYTLERNSFSLNEETEVEVYYFNWFYENSYDEDSGIAKARITVFYKQESTHFSLVIVPDNLKIITYSGEVVKPEDNRIAKLLANVK